MEGERLNHLSWIEVISFFLEDTCRLFEVVVHLTLIAFLSFTVLL